MFDTAYNQLQPIGEAMQAYYGPNGMSEWKRGQTVTRREDTTRAFDNARASMRRKALASGFGYSQPLTQANEAGIERGRAQALARVPGDVETESIPIMMNAAQLANQNASSVAGIGASYDPLGYYKVSAELDEGARNRRAALWNNIISTGGKVASAI